MEVSVTLEFCVDGVVDHRVHIVPEEHQVSGINEVDAEAKISNTSFDYSGRHDGGALPKLREGGPHDRMLFAIQEAKKASDEYTTRLLANTERLAEQSMDIVDIQEEEDEEEEEVNANKFANAVLHRKKQPKGTLDASSEKAKKAKVDDA